MAASWCTQAGSGLASAAPRVMARQTLPPSSSLIPLCVCFFLSCQHAMFVTVDFFLSHSLSLPTLHVLFLINKHILPRPACSCLSSSFRQFTFHHSSFIPPLLPPPVVCSAWLQVFPLNPFAALPGLYIVFVQSFFFFFFTLDCGVFVFSGRLVGLCVGFPPQSLPFLLTFFLFLRRFSFSFFFCIILLRFACLQLLSEGNYFQIASNPLPPCLLSVACPPRHPAGHAASTYWHHSTMPTMTIISSM